MPRDPEAEVKAIRDESVLDAAMELAVSSPIVEHFANELRAIRNPS